MSGHPEEEIRLSEPEDVASRHGVLTAHRRLRPVVRLLTYLLAMAVLGLLLAEVAVYALLSFSFCIVPTSEDYRCRPHFGLVSGPLARYDTATGFKGTPGEFRVVRVAGGKIAYDNVVTINNAGFHSSRDYHSARRPGIRRIVVLGDSMTNETHQSPWPDRLNHLLGPSYEVYGFGVDGGGVVNWHHTYFRQIVPHFEFDALVLAAFTDDISREHTIFHTTDRKLFFSRFREPPRSEADFRVNYLPRMTAVADVVARDELDRIVERLSAKRHVYRYLSFDVYLTKYLLRQTREALRGPRRQPVPRKGKERGLQKYPSRILDMMGEIIEHCRAAEKPVVLSAIPDREGLRRYLAGGRKTPHQREVEALARRFGVALLFDGYEAFQGIDPEAIRRDYWLKYDMHWGQKASDLYADRLAVFLSRALGPDRLPAAAE